MACLASAPFCWVQKILTFYLFDLYECLKYVLGIWEKENGDPDSGVER